MKRNIIASVALSLFICFHSVASDSFLSTDIQRIQHASTSLWQWKGLWYQYLPVTLVATAPLALMVDSSVVATVQSFHDPALRTGLAVAKWFGEGIYLAAGSALLYVIGAATAVEQMRNIGRDVFLTLAWTGALTWSVKFLLGRARPFAREGVASFHWFEFADRYQSLPSGHTSTAFALASYGARKIDRWWSYALFFPLAALTGISRMYDNKHWLTDVAVGAAVGMWVGFNIASVSGNGDTNPHSGISFAPFQIRYQWILQ